MTHSLSGYRRAFATALALLTLSVPMASSAAQTSPAFVKALEKGEALMDAELRSGVSEGLFVFAPHRLDQFLYRLDQEFWLIEVDRVTAFRRNDLLAPG